MKNLLSLFRIILGNVIHFHIYVFCHRYKYFPKVCSVSFNIIYIRKFKKSISYKMVRNIKLWYFFFKSTQYGYIQADIWFLNAHWFLKRPVMLRKKAGTHVDFSSRLILSLCSFKEGSACCSCIFLFDVCFDAIVGL